MPTRGTRHHAIRVADDLWSAAAEKAAAEGASVSEVVRDALAAYVAEDAPEQAA